VTDLVQAAAEHLAMQLRTQFETADSHRRWDFLMEWFERELAWHADVVAGAGRGRVRVHQCPFHAISRRQQPSVCGVFFRTLIRRLYHPVTVEHVPLADGVACCELLVDMNSA
jgi:predicted ArsR family transcriptional regulator